MAKKKDSSAFTKPKVEAASNLRNDGGDDTWGTVFDLAVGTGVGIATMSPAAGLGAYKATQGIREGLMGNEEGEFDTEKLTEGAMAGIGAYSAGKSSLAETAAEDTRDAMEKFDLAEGSMEGLTDDEQDLVLAYIRSSRI
jgi:hypothetical protein